MYTQLTATADRIPLHIVNIFFNIISAFVAGFKMWHTVIPEDGIFLQSDVGVVSPLFTF